MFLVVKKYLQKTNGAYFAWHMRTAKVLLGNNPFDEMVGPSPFQMSLSLWLKIQQYTGEIRKAAKNVFKSIKDLLMIQGLYFRTRKEQLGNFNTTFTNILNDEEVIFLDDLVKTQLNSNFFSNNEEQNIKQILEIQEKLYAEFLRIVKDKLKVAFLKNSY